jgi:hypothetical protein
MDHEQAKGAADKAKGANKDTSKQAQKRQIRQAARFFAQR